MHKIIISTLIVVFLVSNASADVIKLKDGRNITGDIIDETKDTVVVSRQKGSIVFSLPKANIESIEKASKKESNQEGTFTLYGEEKKETFIGKIKNFCKNLFKSDTPPVKTHEHKKYLLEKYKKEVHAAKEARKASEEKMQKKKEEKAKKSRRRPCRRRRCGSF